MSNEKKKEAEAPEMDQVKDGQDTSTDQAQGKGTGSEPAVVESEGPAEAGETAAGETVQAEKNAEAGALVTEPETRGENAIVPPDEEASSGGEDEINLDLLNDSTSIQEIEIFVADDDGKILGDPDLHTQMQIFNAGGNPEYRKKSEEEKLEYGKTLCSRYYWQMHNATLRTGAAMVEYAIAAGNGFRNIKTLVTSCGKKWEDWYVSNMGMPGRTLRTVQRYMDLSRRTDAHAYKHLGLEKLLHLVRETKGFDVEDKIGTFLDKFDITADRESEETADEFKFKVDAGIMVLKLSKAGVSVPFELMLRFAKGRVNLNSRMISELNLLKDDRQKVYEYIDSIITNQGKMPKKMEETEINYFNDMIDRMIKSAGEMAGKAPLARKLSLETINKLEEKIADLKRLITSA